MVKFTNITFNEEWVCADAYDYDNNVKGTVRINRKTEQFLTDCNKKNQFNKGMLYVLIDVNEGKIKQNGERVVAWG